VIENFKSKALRQYWTKGDPTGLRPDWVPKIRLVLSRLDAANSPLEMDVPGFGFHPLKGRLSGRFAVTVSRNWRITFGWSGENAINVDLEDYHGR
jgi:proteic killer suppression protein